MSLKEIHNLDYVVLLCRNVGEMRAFYRDVMGFALEYDSETWISFRVGSALLGVRQRGRSPAGGDDGAGGPPGSTSVQLAFRVPPAAVEACHAELVARGVPIVRAPTELPKWRHRTLFFCDPENNLIEIYAEY